MPTFAAATRTFGLILALTTATVTTAGEDVFRQLEERWPTPDSIRRPSGAPGPDYWQQKVDYKIAVRINEKERTLQGREAITYHNNSPDELTYLWLQLDQNRFAPDSDEALSAAAPGMKGLSYAGLRSVLYRKDFKGGYHVTSVTAVDGTDLPHQIIGTMMRVTLPEPLAPGDRFQFGVDWAYRIIDATATRSRAGYEAFKDDGNDLFAIAQWYPRLCAYTDFGGWQTKQTTGQEFALEFGDFEVAITVPDDHIVGSTGELQNPEEVLTQEQRDRMEKARTASEPILIVTEEEAVENEKSEPSGTKTWRFKADRVRDFAFASSRKFLWDAQGFDLNGRTVMAMSYWPKEGGELWKRLSTQAVIHAVKSYSKFTFDFPYPVMISVNAPIPGMEYPMITFQARRPEEDGTFSEEVRNGLISVIIHEVGHNWFPMVVNSDERQWRWMDEGMNSFVQTLAEQEWDGNYPSRILFKARRQRLLDYMKAGRSRPIMSAPEVLLDGGHTAYSKPALALTVLRETVLGRETFDFAFKQYSQRWMFKRPNPSDFFRSMEDAAGRDLDWFWNTWFYKTDHVDVSVDDIVKYRLDTRDPVIEKARQREEEGKEIIPLTVRRNEAVEKRVNQLPAVDDFYTSFDKFAVRDDEIEEFKKMVDELEPEERDLLKTEGNFYVITMTNHGGMVTPVPLKLTFGDGSTETVRIPAEVWRFQSDTVDKLVMTKKSLIKAEIDPDDEIADVDPDNNAFPRPIRDDTLRLEKQKKEKNVMQKIAEARKKKEEADAEAASDQK